LKNSVLFFSELAHGLDPSAWSPKEFSIVLPARGFRTWDFLKLAFQLNFQIMQILGRLKTAFLAQLKVEV
jgi:hypothetical protein